MKLSILNSVWQRDLIIQWIATIYVAILGFILSVFLARELGVEGFGNYSYVISLVSIFFIIQDGGFKTLIFRDSVDNKPGNLISFGIGYLICTSVIAFLIIVFFQPEFWPSILVALNCMGLMVICEFVSSQLKGKGDFKSDAIFKMAIRSFTAFGILFALFFFKTNSIISLFIAWSIALIFALIWPIHKGYLKWPNFNFKSDLVKSNFIFLSIDIATVLYFRIDIILLKFFGNIDGDIGQYSAAYRILEGIILLATPLAMISFRILRLNSRNKHKFFQLIGLLLLSMLFIATIIVSIGALWGSNFMVYIFGPEYLVAGDLLIWLLLAVFFILPNYILAQGAIALNKEISYAKIVVIVAFLNIIMNIILIPDFGSKGAAWATVIAEGILFFSLVMMLWNERKSLTSRL